MVKLAALQNLGDSLIMDISGVIRRHRTGAMLDGGEDGHLTPRARGPALRTPDALQSLLERLSRLERQSSSVLGGVTQGSVVLNELDHKQCSHRRLTGSKVTNFIKDLHSMVPDQSQKCIDWDQTRTEQGTWPTKTIVSVWFRNETNLSTMVGMLDIIKKELKKEPCTLHGQEISSRLEISPKRKPLARAHALFYKRCQEGGKE